jgi:hypothetical protein
MLNLLLFSFQYRQQFTILNNYFWTVLLKRGERSRAPLARLPHLLVTITTPFEKKIVWTFQIVKTILTKSSI